ncbi:carboxypeptidase N subunit 2-like isoform X2 [Vespa velutina]|nr:carboxypeptidase N subunit 2-like isoform X2 [Vespa velutina]
MGQIIDIGDIWETQCPQGCSCEIQKFSDLPLHQWTIPRKWSNTPTVDENDFSSDNDHIGDELLKVATCVVAEGHEKLLSMLPSDIQVLTILRSGRGDAEIFFKATTFQRFTELLSLSIEGIDYNDPSVKDVNRYESKGGIVLAGDALFPLGMTLLYLNLERVRLTSLNLTSKNKANLVIKPMNLPNDEKLYKEQVVTSATNEHKGHRLIFLSQQNSGESDDKEILPYDIYKQEMDGYRENAGLFTGLRALTHLRVYDCALKDISWHMFDGLDSLLYLSLEKNNLRFIPEFCFYGTPNLKLLSLASNQLLTLKSIDLAGLLMLEQLDLTGNNLTFLSELSFPPFPALKMADFGENPMDSVFPSTFEIMNTTKQLYLGGTGSRLKLQRNSLLGLLQLKILYLYNVEIPLLERFILQGMPSLTHLKIRGNISSVDLDAFSDLGKLIDLDLSYCHIQHISMDAFYGLEKVKRIDLSNNDLEFIPPGLFSTQYQKELNEIILTKNKLTTLPWDFFKTLWTVNKPSQVQNIKLDGNPWDCTCSMATWNPHLVNRIRETAPRCFTPKRLQNWGVFHALRKGGLQCKRSKRRRMHGIPKVLNYENNNAIS